MKNLFAFYNAYTSQFGPDDCGIACISMLLKYSGRYGDADRLIRAASVPAGGLSLLDLRNLASAYALRARCVRMDAENLRKSPTPCILHVKHGEHNFHFVICNLASRKQGSWRYLISDPATGISWVSEQELIARWSGGAALYPDELQLRSPPVKEQSWFLFFRAACTYSVLFGVMPALTVFTALLGVALSWMLQRGIDHPLTEMHSGLLIPVLMLLSCIMLAKNAGTYFKQRILIRLNEDTRKRYHSILTDHLRGRFSDPQAVKRGLAEIQRIQLAVHTFFSVYLSDGALVLLLISGMWYFEPVAGFLLSIYLLIILWMAVRSSSGIAWNQSVMAEMSAEQETGLISFAANAGNPIAGDHLANDPAISARARVLAFMISRYHLFYECIGTITVLAMLSYCLYLAGRSEMSYNMLMTTVIVSYFVTVLSLRITQVFPVMTEGARLIRKFEKLI